MMTNTSASRRLAVAALLVAGLGAGGDLLACGDKFLVLSRGTRFQRPAPRRAATILIYEHAGSRLSAALANVEVDATLRKAGYHPTTVSSIDELQSALTTRDWDLILTDVADVDGIRSRLRPGDPVILLPVVSHASGAELSRLRKAHQRILKAPTRNQAFLDAVDAALARQI